MLLICNISHLTIVGIICFVVHHKLPVHKVEAVRPGLEGVLYHQGDHVLVKLWELVNMLHTVDTIWHAESKIEIKCF